MKKVISPLLLFSITLLLASFSSLSFAGYTFNKCSFDPWKVDFVDPEVYDKMAAMYENWVINPNTNGPIRVSRREGSDPIYPLSIKGLTNKKFFHYEKNKYGINIGWTDDASINTEKNNRKWRIERSDNSSGPLRYGEKIAIGWIKNKSFIRYKSREWGINLVWSEKPSYEWMVLGGEGEVRARLNRVILYNIKFREPMVYVRRTRGGHIGWPSSKPYVPFYKSVFYGNDKDCSEEHGVIATRVLAGDSDPSW